MSVIGAQSKIGAQSSKYYMVPIGLQSGVYAPKENIRASTNIKKYTVKKTGKRKKDCKVNGKILKTLG